MSFIDITARQVLLNRGEKTAPVIYLIDSPEHPFGSEQFSGYFCSIVTVPVRQWNDSLTPWPAKRIYREEQDFTGQAMSTLRELTGETIPAIETAEGIIPARRAICGYSLAGLFSLYALTHCDEFAACACVSGSLWYEGWVEHLRTLDLNLRGRFAYLSIGTKEKRGGTPLMRTVQDNMEDCADILRGRGCSVRYVTGPGNHLQFVSERLASGLSALDGFLSEGMQR